MTNKKNIIIGVILIFLILGSIVAFITIKDKSNDKGENTENSVFVGIEDEITFQTDDENFDLEKALKEKITTKNSKEKMSPVEFEIEKTKGSENEYSVKAITEDSNGNKSYSEFDVKLENSKNGSKPNDSKKPGSNNSKDKNKDDSKEEPIEGGLSKPGSIPPGATLTEDDGYSQVYSYKKDIPNGGVINEVVASEGSFLIVGVDLDGNDFLAQYVYSTDKISYIFTVPSISPDGVDLLYDISYIFKSHYAKK